MARLPEEILSSLLGRSAFVPAVIEELGNPGWDEAERRILIVRLSGFRDVQKSSSHIVLFSEVRAALPGAFLDFAFLPGRQERELLSERKMPWFCGLASGRTPDDFELALVSNAFGLELVNLPYLFSTASIPALASERGEGDPIVIMGGSNAASAGAVVFGSGAESDSMLDGVFFGEGEGAIGELAGILSDSRLERDRRLESAETVEGFWHAGSGRIARRRVLRPFPPPLVSYPVLNSEEAATARLQISAGCPGFCSFCLEGWDRRPYREVGLPQLLSSARELRRDSGADTLELFSFNFNTHAGIYELLFELNRIFLRVNLMSQRLDVLSRERPLLAAELAADKRSFTLGIEGVSARMRRYYRKGLDEDVLDDVLRRLVVPGVRELKLFFIVSGLEGEEDLADFALFAARLRELRDTVSPGTRVIVSAGYLVRLPFTPLQFAPLALEEEPLGRIAAAMRSACEGLEFRLAAEFGEYLADQLLALGGQELAGWLLRTPDEGFVFDERLSRGAAESLARCAAGAGFLDGDFRLEKPPSWRPPLAFVEEDRRHQVLYEHYRAARAFRDRPSCLGSACSDCGACDEGTDRAALVSHRFVRPAGDTTARLERLLAAKRAFPSILVGLDIPQTLRGAAEAYRSSWIMRRLAAAVPDAEPAVFEAKEYPLFGDVASGLPPGYVGKYVFRLRGPKPTAMEMAATAAGFEVLAERPAPARFEVEVVLERASSTSAYDALRAWLAAERIDIVERKEGGIRVLEPSARDLKKRIVHRVEIEGDAESDRFVVRLSLGRKVRLGGWFGRLKTAAARTAIVRLVGYGD